MTPRAQSAWNASKESRWIVCDEAAGLDTSYGNGAAERFGRELKPPVSVDTVYRLARAGKTYQRLAKYHGEISARLRQSLTDNYFDAIGKQLERGMVESEAIEWLIEAVDNGQNIETFRAEITESKGADTDWQKEIKYIERHFVTIPSFGMTDSQYRKIRRAAKLLQARIDQLESE